MALAQATIGYNTPAGGGGTITICDAAVTGTLNPAAVKTLLDTLPAATHADYGLALKKQREVADFIRLQQNVQGAESTGIEVTLVARDRRTTRVGVTAVTNAQGISTFTAT